MREKKHVFVLFIGIVLLCLFSACTKEDMSIPSEETNDLADSEVGLEEPSTVDESYKDILLGEREFINIDKSNQDEKMNIFDIKAVVSDEDGVRAAVTKFAIVDLDGNGEYEIVLWIQVNEQSDYGFEILYFQDEEIYGFTLPYRGLMDLKADGTFSYSGGAGNSGIGRLKLAERGYTTETVSESESQEEKNNVTWYDLTPDNVLSACGVSNAGDT